MNTNSESTSALRVLSLEDSIPDFEIICFQLEKAGYQFEINRVENEQDFISQLSGCRYDLVLADFMLPGFDAFAALKISLELCPDIPFICVSGYIGEDIAIELLKQGAVDYVLKDKLDRLPLAVKRAFTEKKEKDIRRKAEEALAESENRFRDILFSSADWVWEVDANGKYTFSSIRGTELFDIEEHEIIGKSPFDFMPEEEASRIKPIFTDIVARKAAIVDLENWNIGKNGKKICLLTNGVPIIDHNGIFKGYRGVDKDITERKLTEQALLQSETKLNYAQEIARMGNWEYNLANNKLTWSKNMYNLLDYLPFEKSPNYQDFSNLVHPEDKDLIDQKLNEIIETRSPVSYDFRYVLKSGKTIWVQNIISPVFDKDKLIELHGVNIDITDKKLAELELLQAKEKAEAGDKLKSAFINNISHEVRTPLNGVIGFSEMLLNPDVTSENKVIFNDIIRKSSIRLLKTINSYMDISMIVSGNIELFRKQFELYSLLDEVWAEFEEPCKSKGIELRIQRPSIPSEMKLNTDPDILRKIFTHLLDNAVKFTRVGSVEFGFRKKSKFLEFFVEDTGVGIPAEKVKIIFENFMQADLSLTRGYEGSGLGLSIANGLVKLLDGELKVETTVNKGSSFYFTLPDTAIISSYSVEKVRRIEPLNVENPIILVAEDDEFNYKFIEIVLKKADFKVIRAENGSEAVKLCKQNPLINLVLMDLKMPVMGGIEATRQIKKFLPQLPIIALTAYVSSTDEYEALLNGCDEYIPKPVNRVKLIETINKLL